MRIRGTAHGLDFTIFVQFTFKQYQPVLTYLKDIGILNRVAAPLAMSGATPRAKS